MDKTLTIEIKDLPDEDSYNKGEDKENKRKDWRDAFCEAFYRGGAKKIPKKMGFVEIQLDYFTDTDHKLFYKVLNSISGFLGHYVTVDKKTNQRIAMLIYKLSYMYMLDGHYLTTYKGMKYRLQQIKADVQADQLKKVTMK